MSNDLHMSFESLPGLLKVVRNRQKIEVCTKRHSKVDIRDSGLQQAAPEMVCFSGCQVTLLALVKLVLKLRLPSSEVRSLRFIVTSVLAID